MNRLKRTVMFFALMFCLIPSLELIYKTNGKFNNNLMVLSGYIEDDSEREIMVGIEGLDSSLLYLLSKFDNDIRYYRNVGCALITGNNLLIERLKSLKIFDIIADVTDQYFEPTVSIEQPETFETKTVTNANTINASALWTLGYNGTNVKIGNIDTGLNDGHIDFTGRVMALQSFISTAYGYDSNDSTTSDPNGHGTHTTGIISGDGSENSAYKGIAPETEIYFAKIGNPATAISVVAALNWLVAQGVEVINFSYGGSDSPGLDIVELAFRNVVRNHNILCSVSAGNEGSDGYYSVGTPGTTDDVITVGNLNDDGLPYSIVASSSKGPTADNHMKPDVLAPGYNIYSCDRIGNGYTQKTGTSMAAPQVTGAIALLIQACKANNIDYNPGVLKSALLQTASLMTPISSFDLLTQGRGIVNVGSAWNYIEKSAKEGNISIIGACNPIQEPLPYWETLKQGQIAELYLSCVSPFKTELSIEITGSISQFITIDSMTNEFTSIAKLLFDIPTDAIIGEYSGELTFKYKTNILDTISLNITIEESNANRMLLNFRTTNYELDHMYGQFKSFTEEMLDQGFVISEQNVTLTTEILSNYEAVMIPDPFNYYYPQSYYDNYSIIETRPVWAPGELTALTEFVDNGGTVFFCFIGPLWNSDESIIINTNVSMINDFTEQYGITIHDTIWTGSQPITVNTVGTHPLIFNVDTIDHYGCSLEVSSTATQITELSSGSLNSTCAFKQTENGGRVIVLTTNFVLDDYGFTNQYHPTQTQNNLFCKNLMRLATAKHRIDHRNTLFDNGTITFTYEYLSGPGAVFGGYLITPSLEKIRLNWSYMGDSLWKSSYIAKELGQHIFFPECGVTELDEFDYFEFYITELPQYPTNTPTISTTTTVGINFLISINLILISFVLIKKRKHEVITH